MTKGLANCCKKAQRVGVVLYFAYLGYPRGLVAGPCSTNLHHAVSMRRRNSQSRLDANNR